MTDVDVNEQIRENCRQTEELRRELKEKPRTIEMVQQGPGHRVIRVVEHDTKLQKAAKQFLDDVYDRASEVDPDSECDWADMARGYLIAKGVSLDKITYPVCSSLSTGNFPEGDHV